MVRVDTGAERLVTSRGVRLPPGSGMSFVGVTEDVTERVQAEAEVRRLAAQQAALRRVAELVAAQPDPAAVAEAVAREVVQLFDAEAGGLVRFDHDGTGVVTGWIAHMPETALAAGTPIDLTEPHAVSAVYATGEAVRMGRSAVPVEIEFVERVAVPVRVGGDLWGALALVAARPIDPGAELRSPSSPTSSRSRSRRPTPARRCSCGSPSRRRSTS